MELWLIIYLVICGFVIYIVINRKNKEKETVIPELKEETKYVKPKYIKPKLKELSEEEIEEIHSKGLITPAEKVKEWEDLDLCAPGDAIGSAAWRCKKFHHDCHDCLVDYANGNDEYVSFYDDLKLVCKGDNMNKTEYNFSIFDNYKCDGQLIMIFNGNNINIVEEKLENKTTNKVDNI